MHTKKRVLLIGLDGATFDLIKPWVKEGTLPNLAKLMKNGVSGELESTTPPVSLPSWMCFATGKNPGKIGVYDLIERKKGSYLVQPSNPSSIKEETIWSILNKYGIRTGVFNVPGTFPPRHVNGFMVTGMFTPSLRENFSYPKMLKSQLNQEVGGYELDVDYWRYFNEDRFLREVYKVTEKREKAAKYLLQTFEVQLFVVIFTSLDRIQHVMWRHMDPNHPQHSPEQSKYYSNTIKEYWEKLDQTVGRLIELFGDNGYVLIMSDHGFGPRTGTFYVNDWLIQKGMLRLKEKARKSLLVKIGQNIEKIYFLLGKTGLYRFFSSLIYKLLGRELIYKLIFRYLSFDRMIDTIDWEQTKAFSCPHSAHFGQIYINLSGRDPQGCVQPFEYEDVRNRVIEELGKLKDPLTGDRLKIEIHKPEEIYSGPYVSQASDIIFSINNGECEADTSFGHESLFLQGSFDLRCTGTHNKKGIFIVSGPDIREGIWMAGAKITDLTPTILHLFGIPIPTDMDGTVLQEVFKEGSTPSKTEVKFSEPKTIRNWEVYERSREEVRKVKDRLRSLGYLS